MIRTLVLSACAALPLVGLISSPSPAGVVMLSMDPKTAPDLTPGSVGLYQSQSSFKTTKNKGIGPDGMFYFTLSSPAFVSISFSGFKVSDIKNNPNPVIGGALLSLCDVACQNQWGNPTQPAGVDIQVADYISPGAGTPQGIEPSQQIRYFSSKGWYLPANTGGAEYMLCLDGIATKTGKNSYSGAVTITVAPEVSTWAMTLLGFAGLGFMGSLARRRRGADPIAL
jgi:hypothetical protein